MGLHFHAHSTRRIKEEERNRILGEQSVANPLDKLISDIQKHITNVQVQAPMINAKHNLDAHASKFIAAIKEYQHLVKTPEAKQAVAPAPKIMK